ncbi:Cerebral cavernous malformations protein 2 [Mactra antiquata]
MRRSQLRPLRTPELTPAGIEIQSKHFESKENHIVEFDAKFLGDVPGVPAEVDTTMRTEVLKIIDRGKKQGLIPLHLNTECDAILCLVKDRVMVKKRDAKEETRLDLTLNEIAHVCYVAEEGYHYLALKHGTPDRLNLAVLLCESQDITEAVCSLISCCFRLAYTHVVIDLIETTIDDAIKEDNRSYTSMSTPPEVPDFVSPSPNHPQSDISTESSQAELLRDYMWQLNSKLKPEELKLFSTYLKNWNYSSNKLPEFCENLYKLYGQERKYLLGGMFPFIPERDCRFFEKFLKKHDVSTSGHGTISSYRGCPPQFYTRSISDYSMNSNTVASTDTDIGLTADLDTLDAMNQNFERIEVSVGETSQSYLPGIYEKNGKL